MGALSCITFNHYCGGSSLLYVYVWCVCMIMIMILWFVWLLSLSLLFYMIFIYDSRTFPAGSIHIISRQIKNYYYWFLVLVHNWLYFLLDFIIIVLTLFIMLHSNNKNDYNIIEIYILSKPVNVKFKENNNVEIIILKKLLVYFLIYWFNLFCCDLCCCHHCDLISLKYWLTWLCFFFVCLASKCQNVWIQTNKG